MNKKTLGLSLEKGLYCWTEIIQQHAIFVVIVFIGITSGLFQFTKDNLGVNTDTADMISEHLDWRQDFIQFKKQYPQYVNTLLLVVEGQTPELVKDMSAQLSEKILGDQSHFESLYAPSSGDYFDKQGLLYLSIEELQALETNLSSMRPMVEGLIDAPQLETLFQILSGMLVDTSETATQSLNVLLHQVEKSVSAIQAGHFYQVSWQNLLNNQQETDSVPRELLIVKPKLNFHQILPGKEPIETLRQYISELQVNGKGVEVSITGEVALAHEELASVTKGAILAGILSLGMVSIILLLTLRNVYLVFSAIVTLLVGLMGTAAFAAWSIGHLNMISVAFAVLYIGLGIDFSIHLCCRYRALLQTGEEKEQALSQAVSNIGISLLFCAITTSAGFYAFLPTSFNGVSELGLISGTGMLISLLVNLTLLPALLSLVYLKVPIQSHDQPSAFGQWLSLIPKNYYRVIIGFACLFAIISITLLNHLEFVADPMKLRDPSQESVVTFNRLLATNPHSPSSISILTTKEEEAIRLAEAARKLPLVKDAIFLNNLIPQDQQQKLAVIQQLSTNYPQLDNTQTFVLKEGTLEHRLEAIAGLKTLLEQNNLYPNLSHRLHVFLTSLHTLTEPMQEKKIQQLENALLQGFVINLNRMQKALQAKPVSQVTLPEDIKVRWLSQDGTYKVEIFPVENLEDTDAIVRFVEQVSALAPKATGLPVIHQEAGKVVVTAFQQAFLYAFIFITLLLVFLFRQLQDVIYVLAPLLLASLMTGLASIVFHIPFNFANIIALPLLLGIGVDNGIHMLHAFRSEQKQDLNRTSTTKAIIGSTFTTICSFGNLAFSPHLGMASMGTLLAIGMFLVLTCTLFLLPALLQVEKSNLDAIESDVKLPGF